jgi:hypothetical protein
MVDVATSYLNNQDFMLELLDFLMTLMTQVSGERHVF